MDQPNQPLVLLVHETFRADQLGQALSMILAVVVFLGCADMHPFALLERQSDQATAAGFNTDMIGVDHLILPFRQCADETREFCGFFNQVPPFGFVIWEP